MDIPLSFEHSESSPNNPQVLVNMMVESDTSGGEVPYVLIGTPGLLEHKNTGNAKESRGGYILEDGSLLTVIFNTVYKITTAGVQTTVGTLSTNTGPVLFSENPTQVMLVDGGTTGYVYTVATGAFAAVSSSITPESITFQDSYGIASENTAGGSKIFYSAVNDFSSWNALDFVVSDSLPDPIIGVFSNHNDVWAFRAKSTEAYYIDANNASVLLPRQGTVSEVGCSSQYSIALGDNAIMWLDDKGMVRSAKGYTPVIISTRQLERDIANKDWTAAKGYTYVQDGHTFYALIFDDRCWVFDISTGKWHKRYGLNKRWGAAWIEQRGSRIYAGDVVNGKIYSLSTSTYTDNGTEIRSEATTREVHSGRKWIKHRSLELHMETGIGTGQVMMSYSDDGGKTWSNEKITPFGPIGEYSLRVIWKRLGRSRNRIYKFAISSALPRKLISVVLDGEVIGS